MVMLIGIVLLALGLSLGVMWHEAVEETIKGLAPLALLFFGVIFLLVGYSERKAAREFKEVIHDEDSEEN
jgi:small basic protein